MAVAFPAASSPAIADRATPRLAGLPARAALFRGKDKGKQAIIGCSAFLALTETRATLRLGGESAGERSLLIVEPG
jgi:hypothetical protein